MASPLGLLLDPEDLAQRGHPDLELLRGWLLGGDQALDLVARAVEGPGGRGLGVALAPGEHLRGDRGAGDTDRRPRDRAGLLEGPLEQQLAGRREHQHRRHQVGAAALVLLGRRGRVVRAGLVGADRLVLDAVVSGQVAIAERHHRRRQTERRLDQLSGGARRPAAERPAGARGDEHRGDHANVLEREPGRPQLHPHGRDQQEGLGQPQRAPQQRHPDRQVRGEHRLAAGGDLDLSLPIPRRGRP